MNDEWKKTRGCHLARFSNQLNQRSGHQDTKAQRNTKNHHVLGLPLCPGGGFYKLPFAIRWSMPGRSWGRKIAEVKQNAAIDDAVFNPPEAKR